MLAAVFLASGVTKVIDLAAFRDRLETTAGLPPSLARPAGYLLPWLELVAGWCLAVGHARREAALVCAVLLVLFTAHALAHVLDAEECGCLLLPESWQFVNRGPWAVVRNVVLLGAAVWALTPPKKPR